MYRRVSKGFAGNAEVFSAASAVLCYLCDAFMLGAKMLPIYKKIKCATSLCWQAGVTDDAMKNKCSSTKNNLLKAKDILVFNFDIFSRFALIPFKA